MLKQLLSQITNDKKKIPTYQIGLVHAKMYRSYKHVVSAALKKYHLSFVDWLLLGLLYDAEEMRYGLIADTLGVEASFVSVLVDQLMERGYIKEKKSTEDKRVKQIVLTKKGESLVPKVETFLKAKLLPIVAHVPIHDMEKYMEAMDELEI